MRNSPSCRSPHSALGRTQKTNGPRRPSGIAFASFVLAWPSPFSTASGKALTSWSKAASSARPTSRRTAKARRPRPRRSLRGRFAPMSCASSITANPSRKQQFPAPVLRVTRPNHRTRLPSRGGTMNWASTLLPRSNCFASELHSTACAACAASCSCLQEEQPPSNPLAHRKSISHMPYGADIDRRSHTCSSDGRDRRASKARWWLGHSELIPGPPNV